LMRSDQQAKGGTHLRKLRLVGQRKPMQPMADPVRRSAIGVRSSSSRRRHGTSLRCGARPSRRAVEMISAAAWAVDDIRFPEDGTGSPWVARQYSGALSKVANHQIRVSTHAVTGAASCPLDWRLFVPEVRRVLPVAQASAGRVGPARADQNAAHQYLAPFPVSYGRLRSCLLSSTGTPPSSSPRPGTPRPGDVCATKKARRTLNGCRSPMRADHTGR
jgi:hypothetical protein